LLLHIRNDFVDRIVEVNTKVSTTTNFIVQLNQCISTKINLSQVLTLELLENYYTVPGTAS